MSKISYPVLRFVFDRRHIATKENAKTAKTGAVELEVYHDRKRKYLPTGIRLYLNQWLDHAPFYVSGAVDSVIMNERLGDYMKMWQEIVTEQCRDGEFSMESLDVYLMQKKERGMTFLEFFGQRNDERYRSGEIRYNTWRSMRVVLGHVRACKRIVSFGDLVPANIQCFDDYLKGIGMRQTSIYKTHKKLKVYVHECLRRELIKSDPYRIFSLRNGKPKVKRYLTEEEMNAVRGKVIVDAKTARVRDLAVFQMFTGLAYVDLKGFDADRIERRGEHYFYRGRREKSGEDFQFMLLSPAVEILRKYDWQLPVMSNQCYNRYLKEVADVCGLAAFSSHDLRRTFASFALSKGMSVEMVARSMGHQDTRQTMEYARLLGKDVEEAMVRLDEKIK